MKLCSTSSTHGAIDAAATTSFGECCSGYWALEGILEELEMGDLIHEPAIGAGSPL